MAVYYFRNTGDSNWGTATNWSLSDGGPADGAVPTSTDDAFFTSNSGDCLLQTTNKNCNRLITTGYTGTITISTIALTVGSTTTLSSGTTITGSGSLIFSPAGTVTLTSNNASLSGLSECRFQNGITFTIADTWTINTFRVVGTGCVLNGGTFNVSGLNMGSNELSNGTTVFNFIGTGTWTGSGFFRHPLTIKSGATVNLSSSISYAGTSLTVESGATVNAGTSTISFPASSTLNTSLITFNNVTFNGNATTITLSSDLNCGGNLAFSNSTAVNGATRFIYVSGSLSASGVASGSGTATIMLIGSGTWSHSSTNLAINHNVTINTTGSYTVGNIYIGAKTLTYSAGTVTHTGNLLINVGMTLDTKTVQWNTITFTGSNGITTLLSDFYCNGSLVTPNNQQTFNGFNFYCNGVTSGNNIQGTTTFILRGTGTLSGGVIRNSVIIDTTGTTTIGNLTYYNGTFTYSSGTVIHTGTLTLNTGNCTLNTNGINWNNITIGAFTTTLTSPLNVYGILTVGLNSTTGFNNSDVNIYGNLFGGGGGFAGGTSSFYFLGGNNQIWSSTNTREIRNNITINKSAGTLTFSGSNIYSTGTLTHLSGNVDTTNSRLVLNGTAPTINTSGVTWNDVNLAANQTVNITSLLNINNYLLLSGGATFSGNSGFSANTFSATTANSTITLASGVTYNTNNLILIGTNINPITFKSSATSGYTYFNLVTGGTCDVKFVTATDIDSSGGRLITNVKGTLTRTINWYKTNPDYYSFF